MNIFVFIVLRDLVVEWVPSHGVQKFERDSLYLLIEIVILILQFAKSIFVNNRQHCEIRCSEISLDQILNENYLLIDHCTRIQFIKQEFIAFENRINFYATSFNKHYRLGNITDLLNYGAIIEKLAFHAENHVLLRLFGELVVKL